MKKSLYHIEIIAFLVKNLIYFVKYDLITILMIMEKIYKNEAANKSGVYKITNTLNGRFYIGSCKRFKQRAHEHEYLLLRNKHGYSSHRNTVDYLQNDFNICGMCVFVFEVIEVIEGDKQLRLDAEQKLLDQYWDGGKQCYNMRKWAISNKDGIYSHTPEETREKQRKANLGKKKSDETREKQRKASLGKKSFGGMKGKKHSEESKQKIGEASEKRWMNEEYKKHMSIVRKGMKNKRKHPPAKPGTRWWGPHKNCG